MLCTFQNSHNHFYITGSNENTLLTVWFVFLPVSVWFYKDRNNARVIVSDYGHL